MPLTRVEPLGVCVCVCMCYARRMCPQQCYHLLLLLASSLVCVLFVIVSPRHKSNFAFFLFGYSVEM